MLMYTLYVNCQINNSLCLNVHYACSILFISALSHRVGALETITKFTII